ncbi:DUF5518 domain-containing protein [Salinirubrum litoreum]|uniref:DUF5518 domain-containing protein n=1 Tax=Salinirubrum litoreum TaxID=1126234 RepID=A0ABD5RG99_9EURY|nr:DUF5518 domain-containing protein [Salinirubrum litoreum]
MSSEDAECRHVCLADGAPSEAPRGDETEGRRIGGAGAPLRTVRLIVHCLRGRLSPLFGGAVAGYLQKVPPKRGAKTGGLSGVIAVVPILLLLTLGFALSHLQPAAFGVSGGQRVGYHARVVRPVETPAAEHCDSGRMQPLTSNHYKNPSTGCAGPQSMWSLYGIGE